MKLPMCHNSRMDNTQIESIIREYLPQTIHMSLATSRDNQPWVCEVHFSTDDDLNIYFCSTPDRRHCEEIMDNPHVAGSIVTQHYKNQKVRGVYFEGTAECLGEVDENHPAYQAVATRFGKAFKIQALSEYHGPRYYKISVKNWYLFDAYESNPPQKYQLEWSK